MAGRELRPVFDEYDEARIMHDADLIRAGQASMQAGRLVVSSELYNQAYAAMRRDFDERYSGADPQETYGMQSELQPVLDEHFKRLYPKISIRQADESYAAVDTEKHRLVLQLSLDGTLPKILEYKDLAVMTDGSLAGVVEHDRKRQLLNRNIGLPQPRLKELERPARQYPRTGDEALRAFSRLAKGTRPLTEAEVEAYASVMSDARPISRVSLGKPISYRGGWYGDL